MNATPELAEIPDPRRPIDRYLHSYSGDHQHPVNQLIHLFCVPTIVWTVTAFFWTIPVPEALFRPGGPQLPALVMEGNAVFRWASYEMAAIAQQALDAAGVAVDDLDVFVPHQANDRITTAMARSLKLPDRVVIARDIAEQGNTSAASIPLALERLLETGEARSGQLALLIGFGAGLVYGAQVVRIP